MTSFTPVALAAMTALAACGGGDEAARVALPVQTAAGALPVAITDLGYAVTIDRLRIAVADLELTVAGEMHQDVRKSVRPHPGHSAGGEVTGELAGAFVLTWDGQPHPVGTATLLVGDYHGANLAFRRADQGDGLDGDDPLLGRTFHVVGRARRGGADIGFDLGLDIEPGTSLVGAIFDHDVSESSTETLSLAFLPTEPVVGKTAFDGLDFDTLPLTGGLAVVRPGAAAHNLARRTLQTHDHYAIQTP